MYYPGNPDTNPVFVHISIKNNSTETMRFKLADDRMFSVDFNGYTIKNLQLPQTEKVIRKRTSNQTVYFREIALETGEVAPLYEYFTLQRRLQAGKRAQ